MKMIERNTAITVLAGFVFFLGVSLISLDLLGVPQLTPSFPVPLTGLSIMYGFLLIAIGLALLALGMLNQARNPYGYFSFGGLFALIGFLLNNLESITGVIFSLLVVIVLVVAIIWPRRKTALVSHH